MSIVRVQASLARDGAMPEDTIVNTWHFGGSATPADMATTAINRLSIFYAAIDGVILSDIISSGVDFKAYNMAAAKPRVPIATGTQALTTATNQTLPAEVAVCCSYASTPESGVPAARRRGRIFLGPISTVGGTTVGADYRLGATERTGIANAAKALCDANTTATYWAVYSPTIAADTGSVDFPDAEVVSGWVDNAYDIQRRRGAKATARTTWVAA